LGDRQKFNVYLRNENNEPMKLDLLTEIQSSSIAAQNISISWDYHRYSVYENQIIIIELVLSVSPKIRGVTNFSFDILIEGKNFALQLGEFADKNLLRTPSNTVYLIYPNPKYVTSAESTYDGTAGEKVRNLCINTQHYGFNTIQHWSLPSGASIPALYTMPQSQRSEVD
jgi:hypothetical protein